MAYRPPPSAWGSGSRRSNWNSGLGQRPNVLRDGQMQGPAPPLVGGRDMYGFGGTPPQTLSRANQPVGGGRGAVSSLFSAADDEQVAPGSFSQGGRASPSMYGVNDLGRDQDAGGGPDGGPTQPPPGGDPLWQTMVDTFNQYGIGGDWLDYQKLKPLFDAARAWGGDDAIRSTLSYNPMKAYNTMRSWLGIGPAYYDRTGDGTRARLFYIPGMRPASYAGLEDEIDYDPHKYSDYRFT